MPTASRIRWRARVSTSGGIFSTRRLATKSASVAAIVVSLALASICSLGLFGLFIASFPSPQITSSTAKPRLGTSTERTKVMNTVPSAFFPVVATVTMPCVGRDFDSRIASTSDSA